MATNYSYGTVIDNGGSAATGTTNLVSALSAAITANSAWTLVEDVNVGSTPVRWVVWKCTAAGSGLPNDFHLICTLSSGATSFVLSIAENYTPGTGRTFTKYAPTVASTTYTPAADGSVNATGSATAAGAMQGSTTPAPSQVSFTAAASTQYWLVVANDHIVISTLVPGSTVSTYYYGAFTSLVANAATADPMPVISASMAWSTTASLGAQTTRHPGTGGVASGFFLWGHVLPTVWSTNPPFTWAAPYVSTYQLGYSTYDLFQGSQLPLSEALIMTYGSSSAPANAKTVGCVRGKFNSIRFMTLPPAGMFVGDTISYNGTKWVVMSVVNGSAAMLADTGSP